MQAVHQQESALLAQATHAAGTQKGVSRSGIYIEDLFRECIATFRKRSRLVPHFEILKEGEGREAVDDHVSVVHAFAPTAVVRQACRIAGNTRYVHSGEGGGAKSIF